MIRNEKLIALRQSLGLTQKAFALFLGVPLRTLSAWECGERQLSDYYFRWLVAFVKLYSR